MAGTAVLLRSRLVGTPSRIAGAGLEHLVQEEKLWVLLDQMALAKLLVPPHHRCRSACRMVPILPRLLQRVGLHELQTSKAVPLATPHLVAETSNISLQHDVPMAMLPEDKALH